MHVLLAFAPRIKRALLAVSRSIVEYFDVADADAASLRFRDILVGWVFFYH
jgi:hypothetical protein